MGPQHLWIIYIMEVSVLFPLRWVNQVKATPKQHFYWCDFCWVANFTAVLVVLAFVVDACTTDALLSDSLRKALFSSAWGIACGPLLLATGVLGNALLFHDADNVASVLIHLFPSLLLFVVRWHHDEVHKAWPRVFHLNFFEEINPWSDIYLKAAAGYSVWLVTYCVWLLAFGMALPNKGYDTIFHANMRGGLGASVAKLLGVSPDEHDIRAKSNDFTRSYFVAYIIGHAFAVFLAIGVSLLCWLDPFIHGMLCVAMAFSTIYNGASRYSFYMVQSYSDALRKELRIPLDRRGSALDFTGEGPL